MPLRASRSAFFGYVLRVALTALATMVPLAAAASCDECGSRRADFNAPAEGGIAVAPDAPSGFDDGASQTSCDASAARKSPVGCDYVVFTARRYHQDWACEALIVSNPGSEPARLMLERDGKPIDFGASSRLITNAGPDPGYQPVVDGSVPPGGSAVIALVEGNPNSTGLSHCPFDPIVRSVAVGVDADETASAFHLVSSAPVFVTKHVGYGTHIDAVIGGAASLRARGSWGSSHLDVGIYQPGRPSVQTNQSDASFDETVWPFVGFAAVATMEATQVAFPSDGGVKEINLAPGEVHRTTRDDLFIGSRVDSDRPVAFFVGSPDSFIPYNVGTANPLLMPVAPTSAWGHEYAAARYPDRYPGTVEAPPHRIVAERDGTLLTYDPAAPPGAPASLNAGELAVFPASVPFVVRSQDETHRFHLSLMMTGMETVMPESERVRNIQGRGGPNLVAVPPAAEFASRFAFATDHSFPDAYLVVIRKKTDGAFADVTLDCAGVLGGWSAIDSAGDYQTVTVTLSAGAFEAQAYPGGSCDNGAHVMTSQGLLTGYLWGWSHAGAYPDEPMANTGGSYATVLYGLPRDEMLGAK